MRLSRCLPVCAVALAPAGCFSPTGSVFTTQTVTTGDLTATGGGATTVTSDAPTSDATTGATTTTGDDATSASADATSGPTTSDASTTDATITDASATVMPTRCGDGNVEGVEECDDGPDNADSAACTSACKLAVCGDGLTCPGCGVPEECDDANMVETDGCTAQCLLAVRYVFVTAEQYSYDFGGLAGADELCNMAAIGNFNPKRGFRAWLSDSKQAARDRIIGGADLPFMTRKGDVVADNIGDLIDGSLQHAIDLDQHGLEVLADATCDAGSSAWTGTWQNGDAVVDEHCSDWLGLNGAARVGNVTSVDGRWTNDCSLTCDKATYMRLYCVEKSA